MRNIYLIILLFNFAFAVVTVGPDGPPTYHFATIQGAIDSVTVNPIDIDIEVYPSTYQENLLIEADMIIRSVGDANNTIIDGSLGRSLGSTIVIRPESMSTHHPLVEIDGFGITNGKGTDVVNNTITFPDGTHPTEKVGGGIFVYVSSPKINNSQFLDNGNNSTDKGGAVFAASGGDDIGFPDRDHYEVNPDLPPATEPLDFSNNTFLGNDAHQGHSVYILGYDNTTTDLTEGYFDVYSPEFEGSPEYWIKAINSGVDAANGGGAENAIVGEVFVSPQGDDNINDGLSWESPFQTILHALSKLYVNLDGDTQSTIFLSNGEFSSTNTGESFPIYPPYGIYIIGVGEDSTILDGENGSRILIYENSNDGFLESISIIRGFSEEGGGGVSIISSNTIIRNVTISNCSASNGGGIYSIYSNPNFDNITLTDNSANFGGGAFIGLSNINFTNSIILDNDATDQGGGLFLYLSEASLNNVTIKRCTSYYGGGIMNSTSILEIVNSMIANSSATEGGGIYQYEEQYLTFPIIGHLILSNTEITTNTAYSGAGIHNWGSSTTIIGGTINNNIAEDIGGGINFYYASNITITGTNIELNQSGNDGGGIYFFYTDSSHISDVTLINNSADDEGGGIFYYYASNITITGTNIELNQSGNDGGGIYFFYTDSSHISDVTLFNNSAGDKGGGICYYQSNNPSIANTTIQGNSAATFGGGLYGFYSHNASFEDITLSENTAYSGAGAFMYYSNNPVFTRGLISNNIATNEGGGLSFFYSANPIFSYLEITGNSADTGGGINLYNTNPLLNNMTFSDNIATYGGGGIYGYESDVDIVNSILWYDSPDEIYSAGYSELNIFFSDIENGWNGEGNIDADPLFINSETGDYTLQADSPCIDAGISDLDGDGVDDITDFFGQAPDMGAYEYMGDILPGDINDDGLINILDVVALVNIVLNGGDYNTAGDLNSDGINNILDVVFLVNIILNG